jgi:hypothetical protein
MQTDVRFLVPAYKPVCAVEECHDEKHPFVGLSTFACAGSSEPLDGPCCDVRTCPHPGPEPQPEPEPQPGPQPGPEPHPSPEPKPLDGPCARSCKYKKFGDLCDPKKFGDSCANDLNRQKASHEYVCGQAEDGGRRERCNHELYPFVSLANFGCGDQTQIDKHWLDLSDGCCDVRTC